jgi:single-strand DNA-binding protein
MINATFKGTFGKDPELSYTSGGTAKLTASLATERSAKVDGEWEKVTDWVRIVAWGKKAEAIERFFGKGGQIIIHGTFETFKWNNNDGETIYGWNFRVNDFEFVGNKNEGSRERTSGDRTPNRDKDDIPF